MAGGNRLAAHRNVRVNRRLRLAAPLPVLVAVLLTWGAFVIAGSAQFSAAVTEPRYAGSVLALQLALGFTLTIVSIRLMPVTVDAVAGAMPCWRPLESGQVRMLPLRLQHQR